MNVPQYYADKLSALRQQELLDEVNRERLAVIAQAGRAKPSRAVALKVVNALQRIAERGVASPEPTSQVTEIARPVTNG